MTDKSLYDPTHDGSDESSPSSGRRKLIAAVVVLLVLAAAAAGLRMLEGRVLFLQAAESPDVVRVSLVGGPAWMPASLRQEVVRSLRPRRLSFDDPALTREVYRLAEANPWIRRVNSVRRLRTNDPKVGMVEIHAEFRRPMARLLLADGITYTYVDGEGFRLPAEQMPRFAAEIKDSSGRKRRVYYVERSEIPPSVRPRRVHYILIELYNELDGSPPAVGQRWDCPALAAGLQLINLVYSRPYFTQITTVNALNFGGRINKDEPHLRMYAQLGTGRSTDIRFGKFPDPQGDWVISPQKKMSYLDEFVEKHGRLAGVKTYIDLRYDSCHESLN